MKNVIENKAILQKIDKNNIVLNKIKCEEIFEQKIADLTEDEILKEIVIEERKKREQFEKERESTIENKKKGNKKKNKKKDEI